MYKPKPKFMPTNQKQISKTQMEMLIRWYEEFDTEDIPFEQMYETWNLECEDTLPPLELVEDAINDRACDWNRFYNYFVKVLNF